METSKKLLEAFDEFRPHINGHRTAIELFLEAVKEVELLQKELLLHNVSQQRELLRFVEVIKDISDMELHHWTNEEVVEYCIKKLQKSQLILPDKHN